jgi:hypothetical protein
MSLATVPSCNSARSAMGWRSLYQAALFETDRRQVPHRIDEAEKAILARVKELFVVTSDHIEEDVVLDDALYGLRALRTCVLLQSDTA